MNIIRIVISFFILLLMSVAALGWFWTGAHQSSTQSAASHAVLALSALAGVVGLIAIWRARPDRRG